MDIKAAQQLWFSQGQCQQQKPGGMLSIHAAFLQGPAAERASTGEEKQLHHLSSPATGEGGRVTPETRAGWGFLPRTLIKHQKRHNNPPFSFNGS